MSIFSLLLGVVGLWLMGSYSKNRDPLNGIGDTVNGDCYGAPGDIWPHYHHFIRHNNTLVDYVGRVPENYYPNNGKDTEILQLYVNSTQTFMNTILVYAIWSFFSVLINLTDIFCKGNKGCLAKFKKLFRVDPVIRFVIFFVILYKRSRFPNKVCFCDYKE